eukprot:TRINITY_DN114_c0_g1_i2.p1 TRINITY_DN114_c0_g1~~TRINITY_DN114_c0_g1_i2.p1  ORF type:complete len:269 (+),score=28.49 TRINITY_DN114_c0_g1_i2:42-848(+)
MMLKVANVQVLRMVQCRLMGCFGYQFVFVSKMSVILANSSCLSLYSSKQRVCRSRLVRTVKAAAAVEPKLNTTNSQKVFGEAIDLLPGGVNSPVRAFKSVGGQPIVFDKVKDAYVFDVDGNKYIDYVGTWGPAIVGHANEEVNEAIKAQVDKGTSFGAPCELENTMAKMVIDRVPSVEMVRFVNSGTEACLSALRVMRAHTKRDKIIKFVGCYHGHADAFLVQAGSGVATLGLPDSPGVPPATTSNTLTATYNSLESVKPPLSPPSSQ